MMFHWILCITLLSIAIDVTEGVALYPTRLPNGLTVHKSSVTWDRANRRCQDGGKVIASPINDEMLEAMKSVIGVSNTRYFIGIKTTDVPGQFVSTEGIELHNMPLAVTLSMVQQLDQQDGNCLTMSQHDIRAVPCWSKLPFMCYGYTKRQYCGPKEEGYKYDESTGHCFKLHTDNQNWETAHWTCLSEGGHLAVIENDKEAQIIKSMDDFTRESYIFIGRHKKTGTSGWMSIYGQPVEELYNVVVGNRNATDNEFQCGGLHVSGKWNYVRCAASIDFICQKEPKAF